mgnify:CR=1 FL=1
MTSEIIIFKTQDGKTDISVKVEDGTVWLTQGQMVELFNTTKQNISLHIKNIFDEGEQDKDSVVKEYLTTAADGKNYNKKIKIIVLKLSKLTNDKQINENGEI